MTKADKPGIEELAAELTFWKTYRETRRAAGINVDQAFAAWAAEQEQRLTSPVHGKISVNSVKMDVSHSFWLQWSLY
jgi:hypothetical protein